MCHKVVTHFTKCAHRVDSHTICNRVRRHPKRGLAQAQACRASSGVQTVKSDTLCGGCEAFFTGLQQRQSRPRHGRPRSTGWKAAPPAAPTYHGALLRGGGDGAGGLEHAFRRTLRIEDDDEREPARERLEKGRGFSHVPRGLPAAGAAATTRGRSEGGGGGGEKKCSSPVPAMGSAMSTGRRASRGESKKRVRFSPEVDVRYFEQHERVRSGAAIEGVA